MAEPESVQMPEPHPCETMQDVFLIYGILKEQRNMTNHANIKEKDKYKALNINELSGLIKSFVQLLRVARQSF